MSVYGVSSLLPFTSSLSLSSTFQFASKKSAWHSRAVNPSSESAKIMILRPRRKPPTSPTPTNVSFSAAFRDQHNLNGHAQDSQPNQSTFPGYSHRPQSSGPILFVFQPTL